MAKDVEAFERWCDKPWRACCSWGRVPCVVYIAPECIEAAGAAYPAGTDVVFDVCFGIAAGRYGELKAKWRAGQVAVKVLPPLAGTWHVLIYLGALYVDVVPHAVASVRRRPGTAE